MNINDVMNRINQDLKKACSQAYKATNESEEEKLAKSMRFLINDKMPGAIFEISVSKVGDKSDIRVRTEDVELINLLNESGFSTVVTNNENSEQTLDRIFTTIRLEGTE